jgi:hypothetical protein
VEPASTLLAWQQILLQCSSTSPTTIIILLQMKNSREILYFFSILLKRWYSCVVDQILFDHIHSEGFSKSGKCFRFMLVWSQDGRKHYNKMVFRADGRDCHERGGMEIMVKML